MNSVTGSYSVPGCEKLFRLIHLQPFREDSCHKSAGGQGGGVLFLVGGIPDRVATAE